MPEGATFVAHGTPGELAAVGQGADTAYSNWMDRAQQRRMRDAEEERAAAEYELARPILQAKAQADLVKMGTELEAARGMQEQRSQAYVLKPVADKFFNDIIIEPNEGVREGKARDWLGAYGQLDNVKEFESEMKSKKDILAKILTEAQAMRALDLKGQAALDVAGAKAEAADALAKQKAEHDALMQTQKIQHDLDIARIRAESAGNVADTRAASAAETATTRAAATVKAAEARTQHQFEFEKMKALRDEAIEKGDEESAAIFEGRLQKLNAISGEASKAIPRSATPAKVAPTTAPANAASITVGGKSYPIYKDKAGNRAYLIDGHYVPIESQ